MRVGITLGVFVAPSGLLSGANGPVVAVWDAKSEGGGQLARMMTPRAKDAAR